MDEIGKNFKIDIAMIPYAYQGPYPAFYENLSEGGRTKKANEKKLRNYDLMFKFINSTKPKKFSICSWVCLWRSKGKTICILWCWNG